MTPAALAWALSPCVNSGRISWLWLVLTQAGLPKALLTITHPTFRKALAGQGRATAPTKARPLTLQPQWGQQHPLQPPQLALGDG